MCSAHWSWCSLSSQQLLSVLMDDGDAEAGIRRNLDAAQRAIRDSLRLRGKVEPAYGAMMQLELCCIICGAEVADSNTTCVHLDPAGGSGARWDPTGVEESDRFPFISRAWLAALALGFTQEPVMTESERFAARERARLARSRARTLEVLEASEAAAQAAQVCKRFRGDASSQQSAASLRLFCSPALHNQPPSTAEPVTWPLASLAQRRDMIKRFHWNMQVQEEPAGPSAEEMAEGAGRLGSSAAASRPRRQAEIIRPVQGLELSVANAILASNVTSSRAGWNPAVAPILRGVQYGPRNSCAVDTLLTVLAFTMSDAEISMLGGQEEEAPDEDSLFVRESLRVLERVLNMIRSGNDQGGQQAKQVWYAHMCVGLPAEWEEQSEAGLVASLDQQSFTCCCTCGCSYCRRGDCKRCEDSQIR